MSKNRVAILVVVLWTFFDGVSSASASTGSTESRGSVSAANASYSIEVSLDPASKLLVGRQVLTWRNIQDKPTDELWFHLYWNAWRNNRSTWMLEDRLRERSDLKEEINEGDWGWIEIDSMRVGEQGQLGAFDLSPSLRFEAPDDGNLEDRTVVVASLPEAVAPGETIRVETSWRAKIPRTFARTGFRGNFFFIAHWFPKLGVFEGESWNCHQYHASTEYYSDYGNYDVSITVPEDYVLGATGRLQDTRSNPDGSVTFRHMQEDVHAFTWTTSPDYLVRMERFESSELPDVEIRLLIQPEHLNQAERHFRATKVALDRYGRWYGPYPYGHVTVIDPAWGSGAGGMEYPTLFTAGTRLFNPFGGGSPEGVTIHEAGHQFWYGLVGNNEFEHAWIDEGLNTYSANRALHDEYGAQDLYHRLFKPPETKLGGFFPVKLPGFRYGRSIYGSRVGRYREYASIDRQDTPSYKYYPKAGSGLSYSKTTLWLATLERWIGWDRLQPAMAEFFRRGLFEHPGPEDFVQALSEDTGMDLSGFFDQVFRSSEIFDYSVDSVASFPVELEGFQNLGGELDYRAKTENDASLYRTEVVVRRLGSGIFPVDLLLVFEDGEEIRHRWDGTERWRMIVEEHPTKLRYAAVDPDEILLLDLKRSNNSMLLESKAKKPALKWASRWMVWFEDLLITLATYG